MAISKVTLNGDTLMDVTQDTVAANNLLSGETATGADGESVTGAVATKTSSDMTASGATVTAPAGYYATAASKSVASGSASTPATTITANPTISVSSAGLITATTSTTKSVTPTVSAGYVSTGTAGTITVSGSNTQQLTTQAAKTVTPTTSSQTAVASGRYTTGAVTVAAIPSEYVIPTGTKTITENGTGIDVASYASVDVDVSGSGGGVTYGEFTVNKGSSAGTNSGFITYVTLYNQAYSANTKVPIPQRLESNRDAYTGTGIIEDDGYMYVGFYGLNDTVWPQVTATSGTADNIYNSSVNSAYDRTTYHPFTFVWYRLSPGAVVTFTAYNNN